jgi:hypothetical protein
MDMREERTDFVEVGRRLGHRLNPPLGHDDRRAPARSPG